MASQDRYGDKSRGPDFADVLGAYQVVLSVLPQSPEGPKIGDDVLLNAWAERSDAIRSELTRRAIQRFGPSYYVQLGPAEPEASVRSTVLLAVRYPVRAAAAAVEELRRFAGEIEVAIAEELDRFPPVPYVSVTAELDEASVSAGGDTIAKTPWDRIAAILGVVGTSVGVLGFVTFVGGAIDWGRFEAAGLPPEESLSVVPTTDLVVVGARTLVPAITWGLAASALYVLAITFLGRRDQRALAEGKLAVVVRHADTTRGLLLAAGVFAFETLAFIFTLQRFGWLQYVVFVSLGLLMAGLTYTVAKATSHLVYMLATVFLALSIFMAGVGFARARSTPELRAAAVVRENKKATIGFFVAEGSGRVYLARTDLRPLERGKIDANHLQASGHQQERDHRHCDWATQGSSGGVDASPIARG